VNASIEWRSLLNKLKSRLLSSLVNETRKQRLCTGRVHAELIRGKPRIESLREAEFQVFSQWGEDGIIEWLVSMLEGIPEVFIEFGVQDYTEANTRFLLENRNWKGLILDGDIRNIETVRRDQIYWRHELEAVSLFVTTDNIEEVISSKLGKEAEVGILSIDIDGNDYWVWEKISSIKPWVVICEYNSVFGDKKSISTPYSPRFSRSVYHYSNLAFGASIKALEKLGAEKGYKLLGTNSAGNNAFFARKDVASRMQIDRIKIYPSRFRESRNENGVLTMKSGVERIKEIQDVKVVELLDSGGFESKRLGDLKELYSDQWAKGKPIIR